MATTTQSDTKTADYFIVFALPRKLNLDTSALERDFYRLSRELHPDRFARAPKEDQESALEQSSQLNDAYRTLKDPIARTQYLLELEGVKLEEQSAAATQSARTSGEEKKQVVPPELLEEVFELNMQLQELKMGRDPETIENLQIAHIRFQAMLDVLLNELRSLWNHWDAVISQPVPDESTRTAIRDKMVALLNRRSYIRNLVRDVNAALTQ
jgi:molecular chaperone HscB